MKKLVSYIKESYFEHDYQNEYKLADFIRSKDISDTARREMLNILKIGTAGKRGYEKYPEKIKLEREKNGNLILYFDGENTGVHINGEYISDKSIKELGWNY